MSFGDFVKYVSGNLKDLSTVILFFFSIVIIGLLVFRLAIYVYDSKKPEPKKIYPRFERFIKRGFRRGSRR